MKRLILPAIRCSLMFTAVAAFSVVYPASVQAVPTTYQYTGNPFTDVSGPYTTSDFVTAIVTLAGPLPPNFSVNQDAPDVWVSTVPDAGTSLALLSLSLAAFGVAARRLKRPAV